MSQRQYVFLMPAVAASPPYQQVIDRLAKDYAGPRFPAHVTVFVGAFENPEGLGTAVRALARVTEPLTLTPLGVAIGETHSKCFFARFAPTPALVAITEAIRLLAVAPADYVLDPHLSLYYGEREAAERIGDDAQVPEVPLAFDRLRVVRPSGRESGPPVVKGWVTTLEVPLQG